MARVPLRDESVIPEDVTRRQSAQSESFAVPKLTSTVEWMNIENKDLLSLEARVADNNMRYLAVKIEENTKISSAILKALTAGRRGSSVATSLPDTNVDDDDEGGEAQLPRGKTDARKRREGLTAEDETMLNAILERDFDMLKSVVESHEFTRQGGKKLRSRSKYVLTYTQVMFEIVIEKLSPDEPDGAADSRLEEYVQLSVAQKEMLYLAVCKGEKEIKKQAAKDDTAKSKKQRKGKDRASRSSPGGSESASASQSGEQPMETLDSDAYDEDEGDETPRAAAKKRKRG